MNRLDYTIQLIIMYEVDLKIMGWPIIIYKMALLIGTYVL